MANDSSVTSTPMVEEPEEVEPYVPASMHLSPQVTKPSRPFVPKIDPFATSKTTPLLGELTPASSGSGSAAASPISPGSRRSPFLLPPRKASVPVRRPPSPELLSQDCAFPPFPTNKSKKNEALKGGAERTRTPENVRSKSFESERQRSLSTLQRPRLRQGTGDSSRPSTASSSRQASLSSRAGSRSGSVDVVPPLPLLQQTPSHAASDPGTDSRTNHSDKPSTLSSDHRASEAISEFPAGDHDSNTFNNLQSSLNLSNNPMEQTPSYRSKRPPPITNMPSQALHAPVRSHTLAESTLAHHKENVPPIPTTPTTSLARSLTNLFTRKRGLSTSSKKSQKVRTPPTDGPRFVALSPDPEPIPMPRVEVDEHYLSATSHKSLTPSDSSANTELITSPSMHDIQQGPCVSVDIRSADGTHPQPSQGQIADADTDDEASVYEVTAEIDEEPSTTSQDTTINGAGNNDITKHEDNENRAVQRDTLQLEQDLEERLAAMTAVPQLTVVKEEAEDVRRASLDSASSYGSVGFSYSSTSSFHNFEGHSQGSSISTARTSSTTGENLAWHSKLRNPDAVPDSPTDPYLQPGRLTPVHEIVSSPETETDGVDEYFQAGRLSTVKEGPSSSEDEKAEDDDHTKDAPRTATPAEFAKFELSLPLPQVPPVLETPSTELDGFDFPVRSSSRRPSTPGGIRGICRGCSKPITIGQKSVSSKDGRLTGKYHKECFGCFTCKQPFATADFYVLDDHPYCAQHYHQLNDTLCEGCGNGIEGHYLETSNISGQGAKKFHPHCLKCATCKIQLNEDYFELGGRVYCEKDAFRSNAGPRSPYGTAPSRPSPLNREYISSVEPGHGLANGRFPERRLTRLMTTS